MPIFTMHHAGRHQNCSAESTRKSSHARLLDAALLNGHLEWLLNVGFSVDMILEWAIEKQTEKSKSESITELSESHCNSFHDTNFDDALPERLQESPSPQAELHVPNSHPWGNIWFNSLSIAM